MSKMEEEIGQAVQIPDFFNAECFVAARLEELSSLTSLLKKTNRVTSIFQRLPKRMRRRTMSHTVKRVPRVLREVHRRQLLKNKALLKSKNKRKLHRKRPKHLLLEYNRRQKSKRWLETHIWHAKRFRMVSKWGYKFADQSYDKTFRASYRAMKSHCLIQDISYYGCIEIVGPIDVVAEGFSFMTCQECDLSVQAKCWLNGTREGKIKLYHAGCYPRKVIGSVTFMWRPSTDNVRALWLWCHPAFYYEVLDELINVFKLELIIHEETTRTELSSENFKFNRDSGKVEKTIISLKNVPTDRIPRYSNGDSNVVVLPLKDTLNRFRLRGPLANSVLTKALHPAELFESNLLATNNTDWWKKYTSRCSFSAFQLLEKYNLPSQFPSHSIMGACIIDPRLFLKRKREKAVPSTVECEYCLSVTPALSDCPIWDSRIRDTSSITKVSLAKINELRSKLLVPGFDEQLLTTINNVVPILIVQNPGPNSTKVKLGFASGWDIIVPANWAMPVWLSLILCGAKPGGMREAKTLNFESQRMPELFPDSQAGAIYCDSIREVCENSYFMKPPNKRVNFVKYGIPTPFLCPWQKLVDEWSCSKPSSPYFVFRNEIELRKVRAHIDNVRKKKKTSKLNFSLATGSLIPVNVTVANNGSLTPFSHICLPTEADLRRRKIDKLFSGPSESLHFDTNHVKRKRLRQTHTKLLKRLRRKRLKDKRLRMLNGLPTRIVKRPVSPTAELVDQYLKQMRKLWVPECVTEELRKHCEREICGFVTMSGFSFMQGCSMGQGYITSESLSLLLDLQLRLGCELLVLTRTPYSLCYRFCTLEVAVE